MEKQLKVKKEIKPKSEIPEKGFYFDNSKDKHDYYFDGKPMTGCTSVLSIVAKPALIQWAANMAVGYIKENFNPVIHILPDKLDELLIEAKTAHRKKKEGAADIGTTVHKMIENWIKTGQIDIPEDLIVAKMVLNFINWATKNKVKFLENEKQVYSKELFVAGTADFVCEIDGKKFIGDIKTGGVYDRVPFWQTAGYRKMLEEMNEKDYQGSVIVNIKKDGKFNEEKDVIWSFDYSTDLKAFLACLDIYRILNNY